MFGGNKDKASGGSGNQSLIGIESRIEGNLNFSGECYVDGTVKGDVSSGKAEKAYLSVSEGGCIQGNVYVPVLDLSGKIEGDVYVSDKAVFGATAKVVGNVHYNLIEIAAGAEINGQLIHDEPKPQAAEAPKAAKASKAEAESYYETEATQKAG